MKSEVIIIATVAIVCFIVIAIVIVGFSHLTIFRDGLKLAPLPDPCSYEACCNNDENEQAFSCDGFGCRDTVPNWAPPECKINVTTTPLGKK
ncbi:hypothetical protein M0R72_15180 [Candidatus Pacearchaeota archaeon]|jgi:hypothetical protein|nr:hypothetical protein [Candidatus Pacearchaeota archaeon]